jgi:histone-lysine N-methyltransferase SETD3
MPPPAEADPKIAHLLHWLEQGGASFPKIHVVSLGGGERGIFARTDIAAEEPILRVSRQYFITAETARASDMGRALEAHAKLDKDVSYLLPFLLQERERGERSPWKPQLDVLPRSFPTHPYFFQEEELALLKGSFLRELVDIQRRSLAAEHASLCERVPGFDRFSLDDFAWAHFSVVSRTFGVKQDGRQVECQVPLADMINDGRPYTVKWGLSEDGQYFEMKALGEIPAGTELQTSYGAKSNLTLMLYYGFVHENNVDNEVSFALGVPSETPLAEQRRRLLGLTEPSERKRFQLTLNFQPAVMDELFFFLRVLHTDAEDLARLQAAPDARAKAGGFMNPINMMKVAPAFAALCKGLLAGYETSLEEDERLLQQGGLSLNARNCILLRRGEKRILTTYAQAYAGMATG